MKAVLILLFLPLFTIAQKSDSLLIYYNFNQNQNDQSGNGNHADITNCTYRNNSAITSNSAIYVAGYKDKNQDSGYVEFPEVLDGASEFTVSIFVKFISFEKSSSYEECFVTFGSLLKGGTGATGIYYRESDKRLIFAVQTTQGNYYNGFNWDSKWNNTFQHFAFTYNSSSGVLNCYHNGILLGSKGSLTGKIETHINKAALGKHFWYSGITESKRMEFEADELYVFNEALDSSNIKRIYNNTYFKNDTCRNVVTVFDTVKIVQYDTVQIIKYDTVVTNITNYDTVKVRVEDTLFAFFNYVALDKSNQIARATIFPNPANSTINLDINDFANMENMEFEIVDLNGKTIERQIVKQAITTIDMSKQGRGLYIMKLYQGKDIVMNKKLVLK